MRRWSLATAGPGLAALALCAGLHVGAAAQPVDEQERNELRSFLEQTIDGASSFQDRYDAEVWLVDMSARLSRYVEDPQQRLDLLRRDLLIMFSPYKTVAYEWQCQMRERRQVS